MADGRRHSVDVPISRTLIALRRVRSLRDPSTNSMSKFSALLENVNWETNSANGISLRFTHGCQCDGSDHNCLSATKNFQANGLQDDQVDDLEFPCNLGKSKLISCENHSEVDNVGDPTGTKLVEVLDNCRLGTWGNKSLSQRYSGNHMEGKKGSACMTPIKNCMEKVDTASEPIAESPHVDNIDLCVSSRKASYSNKIVSSGLMGNALSCTASPCLSTSDALSSCSISLFAKEENDFMFQDDGGCAVSCCWARTPKFRVSNSYCNIEGHPLLSREVDDSTQYGRRNLKLVAKEPPRTLSQKFRPKSFHELVGQTVVTKSLLCAISRGRIASLYLFHGPRGTGKTSASRIFAAALNCLSLRENKPCGLCRECVMFFSGRSKDVKEVDSVRINRAERIRSLLKNAAIPPLSSRFKVFIVDECQLLHADTWATFLNSLDNLSQHVVFLLITPDLDKLPRSAVTRSQRYHFPKIKDDEIASRLGSICVEESLEFDQLALNFIAAKSNGSLRDAETMLDQLSLLGKRITLPLAHELIGVASDDELLDLLDLALSSDTSKTVTRARDLMRSRIDPMQLVSQLANLIMDILAGKCQEESSEVRRKFSQRYASEADMHRLSLALKILSETEKQLRMSKNQSTWLTVALLQLSSIESSSLDSSDSKSSLRNVNDRDGNLCRSSSTGEGLKRLIPGSYDALGFEGDPKSTLESVWKRATDFCQSNSLKKFLRKRGKLSSVQVDKDLAIAELEFHHPDYVSKAEKSWKLIASSLQAVLGCNIEIRMNLVLCAPASKCAKLKKLSLSLFSCPRRMCQKSQPQMESGSGSECSDHFSEKPMIRNDAIVACTSDCGSNASGNIYHSTEMVKALRNSEGNILRVKDDASKTPAYGLDFAKGSNLRHEMFHAQEKEYQPHCFPGTLGLQKKWHSMANEGEKKLGLSDSRQNSLETSISLHDSVPVSNDNCTNSKSEHGLRENSSALCWKSDAIPASKVTRN
ncbi:hypothetical protein K2173_026451 [Erythroxylum novogranatense]|uniref:AAA+ ATPase domain-containing protein n=1 Tax=Erythroxylum novogranatense TaxID=1862640 RepID=A0AAV8TYZ4_9ROSI|nr:hypothetical protein K2173_026451 [Erythroxylum novogranatense]